MASKPKKTAAPQPPVNPLAALSAASGSPTPPMPMPPMASPKPQPKSAPKKGKDFGFPPSKK